MMPKKLIYIPVVLLFLFAMSVLVVHYSGIIDRNSIVFREANLPFGYTTKVTVVTPEAEAAGIRVGDEIKKLNGSEAADPLSLMKGLTKLKVGDNVSLEISRKSDAGEERFTTNVTATPMVKSTRIYAGVVTGFLYTYAIPTVAILLAFWVLFLRPLDPLAWALMVVLLGMSSISFELHAPESYVGTYRTIFYSSWALGMLIFGIYFPERWSLDKRFPWLKWILIVPLLFQILLTVASRLAPVTGFNLLDYIRPLVNFYNYIGFFVNLIAISMFFMILGWKSGTLENKDSRRRLKLLVWGTGIAMGPTFLIVLYQGVRGASGSFFELVPFWVAVIALLLLNLFPLTLAYVIVVQQAMDAKVVLRQGIQYALATNGVKVLQAIMLIALILGVIWVFRNFSNDAAVQIGFIVAGFAILPLIDYGAKRLKTWIDKRFFRDAYDAEQILLELSEDVRTMVETKPLLETVSSKISESLHVPQVSLLLKQGDRFLPAYALGFDTPPNAELNAGGRSIQTLKKNQHVKIFNEYREVTSTPTITEDEKRQIEELNAEVLLPVASKNELAGIIALSHKRSEEPYTPTDIRLLKSVATQTGMALENSRLTEAIATEAALKERANRELELAREVQERLFPQDLPRVDGLEYYGACRPALGVGGDYYDFIELENGSFGFAIGDVSGKGVGAALMMASLQASLRGQAFHYSDDLASLISKVNQLVYEISTTNRYATFFYGQYDPKTRLLKYVNAGHNPPFLLRKGTDEPILLEVGGPVIGMLPPMLVNYEQGEIQLESGDLLASFTDGISEAMNPAEEEWSEQEVLVELIELRDLPSKEIQEKTVEAADAFANGAKQHDDMTMIVLKVE